MPPDIEIITSAHWDGDPRLNRHVEYLEAGGHSAVLTSYADLPRSSAVARSVRAILGSHANVVILPDPELFLIGSLAARLRGKRAVIDIHEDYGKAAMSRPWVPQALRRVVRTAANVAVAAGRWGAWRVVVAAPELRRESTDYLALNLPDPSSLTATPHDGSHRLVYVGDITEARGALAMIDVMAALDDEFNLLLIGGADGDTTRKVSAHASRLGVTDRLEVTGRLDHETAWTLASGALAGLNLLSAAPAYREAVATKVWEYLAVGLPPIVSDLPGQKRLVGKIDEELVVGSADQAATIIKSLSQDPGRRSSIARAGRDLLETSWAENRPDLVVQRVVEP